MDKEFERDYLYARLARCSVEKHGVASVAVPMVLCIMAADDIRYHEALEDWAEIVGTNCLPEWEFEIQHSLKAAGIDAAVEDWFDDRAEEVRDLAGRILTGQGS